jgi:hypothetical protein
MRDDGRRLVEAYREVTIPSERERAALLERLLADGEPLRGPWGRIAASAAISMAMAAAVLLLLRGGHAALVASRAERARPAAAMHERARDGSQERTTPAEPAHAPRPRQDAIEAPPADAPPPVAPPVQSPAIHPSRKATVASPSPVDEAERLREEGRLLGGAQAALAAGDPAEALTWLDQHRAAFPRGAMQLERRALQAVALCQAGRRPEGRALAEALLVEQPQGPYQQRIARACGE